PIRTHLFSPFICANQIGLPLAVLVAKGSAMSVSQKLLSSAASVRPPDLDPVLGMETIRRTMGVSKATFYGEIAPTLPVITLSARRRGVRRTDYEAWLAARARRPIVPSSGATEA